MLYLHDKCQQNSVYKYPKEKKSKQVTVLVNNWHLAASRLLLVDLDDVILLHLQGLGRLVVVDAPAVKEEAEGGDGHAHPLRVGLLQLSHLSRLLHAEVDFVAVLPDNLQLDVFSILGHDDGVLLAVACK